MQSKKISLFGSMYTFEELQNAVPDLGSLAGVKPYTFFDGPQRGVFAIDVWTGSGLEYTVVPDRGMNICHVKYRGIPLDWTAPTGITSPFLYESQGWHWLRSFHGGLVHTCGLGNVGEPCLDADLPYDNRDFGGHGRISNTPASELSWRVDWDHEKYRTVISGKCRVVSALEEDLLMERTITSELSGKKITLHDRITNHGFNTTPLFLLYHCNFGFPLLSEESELRMPAESASGMKGNRVTDFKKLKAATDEGEDTVVYPKLNGELIEIAVFNPRLGDSGVGVYLHYKKSELPYLTVWKHYQKRSYVMGIEPGTCRVEGRIEEKRKKRAVFLDRDKSIEITMELGVLEGQSGSENA